MAAIDGDGSAWSYLCASILTRELHELGALWHGQSWSVKTIIAAPPWTRSPDDEYGPAIPPGSRDERELHQPLPDDMRPHIQSDGTTVEVRFYTYSALGSLAIYEREDHYGPSAYSPRSRQPRSRQAQAGSSSDPGNERGWARVSLGLALRTLELPEGLLSPDSDG